MSVMFDDIKEKRQCTAPPAVEPPLGSWVVGSGRVNLLVKRGLGLLPSQKGTAKRYTVLTDFSFSHSAINGASHQTGLAFYLTDHLKANAAIHLQLGLERFNHWRLKVAILDQPQ
jgi:hypothetical protein